MGNGIMARERFEKEREREETVFLLLDYRKVWERWVGMDVGGMSY
jgi:hypothetical protein